MIRPCACDRPECAKCRPFRDPAYRAWWAAVEARPAPKRPAAARTPPPKPCVHLGLPILGLDQSRTPCGCRLRGCDVHGVCSVGPSPAHHWCLGCPEFEADDD